MPPFVIERWRNLLVVNFLNFPAFFGNKLELLCVHNVLYFILNSFIFIVNKAVYRVMKSSAIRRKIPIIAVIPMKDKREFRFILPDVA